MAFSDAVLALMKERGWKQADLVRQSGLTATTISRIIGSKQVNPTQDTQERLAAAFGMPVAELVRRAGALSGPDNDSIGGELARLWPALNAADQAAVLHVVRRLAQGARS